MYARFSWLAGPDQQGRRAGVARVHPDEASAAYTWTCTVADDGAGGLELHGVVSMADLPFAIRSALYAAAVRAGFRTVIWWRLKGASMEARTFRLRRVTECVTECHRIP